MAPRALTIDLADVSIALSGEGGPLRWFLDTQTGSTLLLNAEYDPAQNSGLTAAQVEADGARFKPIPAGDSHLTLTDMGAFAAQTSDGLLRESLELALAAPHPERRFRAVLGWLPEEQARWHSFRQGRLEERARAWLKKLGLEP
ncbi:MAG: hypothetical protein H6Q89_5173 [Myxococcaceae bacterium]|nr:hypothetical protein [Myxococcaceae bacterium]